MGLGDRGPRRGIGSVTPRLDLTGDRVAAVLAAGSEDGLISVLLDSIPEEARALGVYSNAHLKTRFEKVMDVCKRVSTWRRISF